MKAPRSFETSKTDYPVAQRRITEEQIPELHHRKILTTFMCRYIYSHLLVLFTASPNAS